jgi:hypothetical protein
LLKAPTVQGNPVLELREGFITPYLAAGYILEPVIFI